MVNPASRKPKVTAWGYKDFHIEMISPLCECIMEWNRRPRFGKGSNQSDNVKRFTKQLWRRYKITPIQKRARGSG